MSAMGVWAMAAAMAVGAPRTDSADYRQLAIGEPLPDITLHDMDGKPVRLRGFVGKKLLICTWASW